MLMIENYLTAFFMARLQKEESDGLAFLINHHLLYLEGQVVVRQVGPLDHRHCWKVDARELVVRQIQVSHRLQSSQVWSVEIGQDVVWQINVH